MANVTLVCTVPSSDSREIRLLPSDTNLPASPSNAMPDEPTGATT
ncbi:hypothetical protein [Kutzneria sp. NPDC051319]